MSDGWEPGTRSGAGPDATSDPHAAGETAGPAEPDGSGPLTVGRLTDEELAVVAGLDDLAVLPVLGEMSDEHRDVAVRTAYRSLVARGLLEAPTPEEQAEAVRQAEAEGPDDVQVPVRVPESLSHVLALRRGAERAVAVSRTTSLGEEYRYAYLAADVVLEEHVTATGLHTFHVSRGESVVDTLAGWALHPEAGDGHGDPVLLPAADDPAPPRELLETLGAALLRADLVLRVPGDEHPPMLGVFSGPAGTWLGRARLGGGSGVELEPVPVEQVREVLAAFVASDAG
ncbi:hypothetical protein JQN72_04315 [Phycicoccus sp. CSK15P-2]|uniref:hypothetical protein n=1 Tax=Phycicoccus sp. CSK15P-2 TaxID=2807627 RepID=UPI001950532C|nr:hypothetical protein [Phycicoccus sp. CSK15P-2]MBM6403466.1 hypothetical protein [Phycicoccus sp. CSK15P-2]